MPSKRDEAKSAIVRAGSVSVVFFVVVTEEVLILFKMLTALVFLS